MGIRIEIGDCREILRSLPDESVHCVVTSPPYYGLRDYGVSGQIGLEATPDEFIDALVETFREVRRVLRDDGTLWLNIGDSYAGYHGNKNAAIPTSATNGWNNGTNENMRGDKRPQDIGLKQKDLIGAPWRLAFALQAAGWYLRQDIIWAKPNPLPESVRDRCTKAHEYLFLLTKSARYYFDQDAIREPSALPPKTGGVSSEHYEEEKWNARSEGLARPPMTMRDRNYNPLGRNRHSVWIIPTQPFRGAHFATFPARLVEPCILAGCPEGGTVLDPFAGVGTAGLVADRLRRHAILIELNPEYAEIARRRIAGDAPLLTEVS